MKVVFTGDLFLGGDLLEFEGRVIDVDEFHDADLRVSNLESPLSSGKNSAKKPVLFAPESAVNTLVSLNVDIVNLANNHIQDKGNEGIEDTLNLLKDHNIDCFGSGTDLKQASKEIWLSSKICVLGYCQYDSPTLNWIQRAKEDSPGVNPLSLEKVIEDLNKIPDSTKAILYFHWGREHVWLTQGKNIELARKLFDHPKVLHIIGMHPHRVQGSLKSGDKECYFSLGNFLFPNFYMEPPNNLYYPTEIQRDRIKHYTYQYHPVYKPTYKKWDLVNRISLILEFDTESTNLRAIPVMQKKDSPQIVKLKGVKGRLVLIWIGFISCFYFLPRGIYDLVEKSHAWSNVAFWRFKMKISILRQLSLRLILSKIKRKF